MDDHVKSGVTVSVTGSSLNLSLRVYMQCRALRQRQQRFPVLLLSTGGTCWHADERRMSIAAAIQWALECNLQGLVLDSGAVQEQSQAVALARSKGLKVCRPCAVLYLMYLPPPGHPAIAMSLDTLHQVSAGCGSTSLSNCGGA